MKTYKITLGLLLTLIIKLSLFGTFDTKAQEQDSLVVSVITAGPSEEAVYTLYGHTAVRIKHLDSGLDEVYNYGLFDFKQPHFIRNFVQGKPLYFVAKEPFEAFFSEYVQNNRSLLEQVLQLNRQQAQSLYKALETNILPANREYRYNFIFANCANIPLMLMDKACGGIMSSPLKKNWTYRQWLASCTKDSPWQTFGTNMALGYHADQFPVTVAEMFLPKMVYSRLQSATWETNGKPVVIETKALYSPNNLGKKEQQTWVKILSPELIFALIFFFYLIILTHAWRTNKIFGLKVTETLILLFSGLAGSLLWYIGFVSEHPFTFPNLNLMLLHPFFLILMVLLWIKSLRNLNIILHLLSFIVLILYFFLMVFNTQALTPGVFWVFLTLSTLTGKHALAQYMQQRKKKKIARQNKA